MHDGLCGAIVSDENRAQTGARLMCGDCNAQMPTTTVLKITRFAISCPGVASLQIATLAPATMPSIVRISF
jgi:hypothetical protein